MVLLNRRVLSEASLWHVKSCTLTRFPFGVLCVQNTLHQQQQKVAAAFQGLEEGAKAHVAEAAKRWEDIMQQAAALEQRQQKAESLQVMWLDSRVWERVRF